MRRSIAMLFSILSSVVLLAATPGASILGTPVVVVYPFTANGSEVTKEAGSRLAVSIATQIANLGGVDVKPAVAGTDRADYLAASRQQGADYYIAGYVTPLGDGVSVVEQLVSTQTGIVVFSNTAQVRTYADAAGQGDVLRDALLRHQGRNLGAYAAPPPPVNTPSPAASAGSGPQANIGRLFGHKGRAAKPAASSSPAAAASPSPAAAIARATPAPTPAPVAAVPQPAAAATPAAAAAHGSDFGVLAIGGPAQNDRRDFTGAAIRNDMIAYHRRVADTGGSRESACRSERVGTLVGGNLSTRNRTILGRPQTTATLELLAYDCAGNVVYRKTFAHDAAGDWKAAVDGVVARAVASFLREPAVSPHG